MSSTGKASVAGSGKTAERVFPMKSLVALSPTIPQGSHDDPFGEAFASSTKTETGKDSRTEDCSSSIVHVTNLGSDTSKYDHNTAIISSFTQQDMVNDNAHQRRIMDGNSLSGNAVESELPTTVRFVYTEAEDGTIGITQASSQTFQRCEEEAIHVPGAIQSFGVLITIEQTPQRKLLVNHVSENSFTILGLSPKFLFSLESFEQILPPDDVRLIWDQLDYLEESNSSDSHINPENTSSLDAEANVSPEVFILRGHQEDRSLPMWKCWCALHRSMKTGNLVILEFELQRDTINPIRALTSRDTACSSEPEDMDRTSSEDDGYTAFSEDDLLESTVSASKSLRRVKRSVIEGDENGTMEIFSMLSQINEQLSSAQDLKTFLKVCVGLVKEITGFHRVMVYQFDDQWNGQVVAELVDWSKTNDLFQGLHFPATDIPAQARDLYKVNKVRILYDRSQMTARLVCRSKDIMNKPLDLTHSFLRAMSPIHIKYLENMGVRSSMSISIMAFGDLWGLVSCHAYGREAMRTSFLVRKLCRLMGEQISHNIERLSYASRLQSRKILQSPSDSNPAGYIVTKAEDLLGLFDADLGMLSIGDEGKILGHIENTQEVIAIREYFRQKRTDVIKCSCDLKKDFPDLFYPNTFKIIAGLLYIPLSRQGSDFIIFFRRGHLRKVHWAGNPYEKILQQTNGNERLLLPRKSFKAWSENVVGRAKEWSEEHIEIAAVLCLVYGKFIEVWRQKQEALRSSKLASLLLNNAGHEVRTPLNAVINYLEIALEGNLDDETRDNLQKSHKASKSLVYVINDLLDLTRSEEGNALFRYEPLDFLSTIRDAVSMFQSEAERAGIEFSLTEDPKMPRRVMGDQAKIRQVVSNIIANAIKHTSKGSVNVEIQVLNCDSTGEEVEACILVSDTGSGIPEKKLDAIFQNFELIDSSDEAGADLEDDGIGLGLAIVARIVRNMNGQIRAESKAGRGTKFTLIFNFTIPPSGFRSNQSDNDASSSRRNSISTVTDDISPSFCPKSMEQLSKQNNQNRNHAFPSDKATRTNQTQATRLNRRPSGAATRPRATSGPDAIRTLSNQSQTSQIDSFVQELSRPIDQSRVHSRVGTRSESTAEKSHSVSSRAPSRRVLHIKGVVPEAVCSLDASGSHSLARTSGNFGVDMEQDLSGIESSANCLELGSMSLSEEDLGPSSSPVHQQIHDQGTPWRSMQQVKALKLDSNDVHFPHRGQPHLVQCYPEKKVLCIETSGKNCPPEHLRVLVAEDDFVNQSIIKKRLQLDKHVLTLTNNGLECFHAFSKPDARFDVILMDLQMPILDGISATKKIRAYEDTCYSESKKRVPILAVSASLPESQAKWAKDAGIDGWILKPVNFSRLRTLLDGLQSHEKREGEMYEFDKSNSKQWERGGWLRQTLPNEVEVAIAG